MVYVYAALAVFLLLLELHGTSFYAMFVALGAVAAAFVAWLAPSAIAAQVGAAALVSILGLVVFRPFVTRLHRFGSKGPVVIGVHGGLVGQQAIALDTITETGHVLLRGESWLAASHDGQLIAQNEKVVVTFVRGTTLLVSLAGHQSLS